MPWCALPQSASLGVRVCSGPHRVTTPQGGARHLADGSWRSFARRPRRFLQSFGDAALCVNAPAETLRHVRSMRCVFSFLKGCQGGPTQSLGVVRLSAGGRTASLRIEGELIRATARRAVIGAGSRGGTCVAHASDKEPLPAATFERYGARPALLQAKLPAQSTNGSGHPIRWSYPPSLGRQDVDPDGPVAHIGVVVLGTSSDHLVVDLRTTRRRSRTRSPSASGTAHSCGRPPHSSSASWSTAQPLGVDLHRPET